MTRNTVPFTPETVQELARRYPAALEVALDVGDFLTACFSALPGEDPRNVFDFEDGLRLIVSRDVGHEGLAGEVLHVSASAIKGTRVWRLIADGSLDKTDFCLFALRRFRHISGDQGPFEFLGCSPMTGIPHWFREMKGGR